AIHRWCSLTYISVHISSRRTYSRSFGHRLTFWTWGESIHVRSRTLRLVALHVSRIGSGECRPFRRTFRGSRECCRRTHGPRSSRTDSLRTRGVCTPRVALARFELDDWRNAKAIPDPWLAHDVLGISRILFNLFAQGADVGTPVHH